MKPSDRPDNNAGSQQPRRLTLGDTFGDGRLPTPANRSASESKNNEAGVADYLSWPGRACLLLALVLAPWMVGSVWYGPQRWIAVSLLAGMGFWWFESAMNKGKSQVFPLIFLPVLLGIGIATIQLIPLPESLHGWLGRQPEIYSTLSGIENPAISISVDRDGTWHQLRLLLIAGAALLLGCRYFRSKRDLVILLSAITANGAALSLFGIIQCLACDRETFWFYDWGYGGQAFGPYVNRNNACGYLLISMAAAIGLLPILMPERKRAGPQLIISREIPLWRQLSTYLAEFIADLNAKKLSVLLAIILIGTGVITSLSRGGVTSMLVAGMVTVLAYGMARQPKNSLFLLIPGLLLIGLLIGFLTLGDGLAERFERTETVDISEDARFEHWAATWPATQEFGWLGSGLGTYVGVHRSYRTDTELTVFRYAENQYFQSLVEAGWPGLVLFLAAWLLAWHSANLLLNRGQSGTSIGVGTAGVFLIAAQAFASFFDFGFYIPANTFTLAVMFGFVAYHGQALGDRLKKRPWIRLSVPNSIIQVMVLVFFGVICLVAYDLHQRAAISSLSWPRLKNINRHNMPLEKTNQRIAELKPLVRNKPTPQALNYLASLLIHRCRLQVFQEVMQIADSSDSVLTAEQKEQAAKNRWRLTDLLQLQENAAYLKRESPVLQLPQFLQRDAFTENFPAAVSLLRRSRQVSPNQAWVHLRLAQLLSITGETEQADESLERVLTIAPANPSYRNVAGLYYLQSGRPDLAIPHLRRYLELKPNKFRTTMTVVTGRTTRAFPPLDPKVIGESLIPDSPQMLYDFASRYRFVALGEKMSALRRAEELLREQKFRREKEALLLANVLRLQGKNEDAIKEFTTYLISRPNDLKNLKIRSELYLETGQLDLALEDAERLVRKATDPKRYKPLEKKIRKMIYQRDKP